MLTQNHRTAVLLALIAGGGGVFASNYSANQDRRVEVVPLAAPRVAVAPAAEADVRPPDLYPDALAIGPEGAFAEIVVLDDPTRRKDPLEDRVVRSRKEPTPSPAPAPHQPVVLSSEALDVPLPEPVLATLPVPAARTGGEPVVDRPSDNRGKADRGRRGGFRIGIRVGSVGNGCRIDGPSAARFVFDRGRVGGIAFGGRGSVGF